MAGDASRRDFYGQGDSLQAPADGRYGRGVAFVYTIVRIGVCGPFYEKAYCFVPAQVLWRVFHAAIARARGHAQGRDGDDQFPP